ncbi:inactive CLIP domain-containing serine protease A3-like isoform 1-T1 [Glossina fuscipes fuscipes]
MQSMFYYIRITSVIFTVFLSSCDYMTSVKGLNYLTSDYQNKNNKFLKTFSFDSLDLNSAGEMATSTDSSGTALLRHLIIGKLTPNIVTPTASFCICVPPGSCPSPLPSPSTDGSGQIDVRIVNNAASSGTPTTSFSCNYGLEVCCQAGSYQCGRRYPPPPGSKQAGLGQANFGDYPWQVALLTTADIYIGSGALLTSQHVLTAAHKVHNIPEKSFKVRVGEWDAASTNEPVPAQDVSVSKVYVHPNFNKNNLQNDVAILKLVNPVSLVTKSTVGTVCLPTIPLKQGQRCYVAGWGKSDFGPTGAYQSIQREVQVPVLSNDNCQTALRKTRLGSRFILNNLSFICAGGEVGKDACTGDGGSPLVCENNGIWYVLGLVAWGIGCAAPGIPGVYVNVNSYIPWIQSMLAS